MGNYCSSDAYNLPWVCYPVSSKHWEVSLERIKFLLSWISNTFFKYLFLTTEPFSQEALAPKPANLSLVSRTCMVAKENQLLQV